MDEHNLDDVELPNLRFKRYHKKSRLGCITCKRRRVKCDERRPSCNRCYVRKYKCSYAEERPSSLSQESIAEGSSSPQQESPVQRSSWIEQSVDLAGVPDTELAQHYLTHTIQTLSETSIRTSQIDFWRIFIPAVALTSPVVRHGMLTLAAMCLHYDSTASDPDSLSKYLDTAEGHGKIFVRESRQKLQDWQQSDNNDTILACSRLLCVLGLAFYRTHRRNGVRLADGAAWTWLHLLRGVKVTYDAIVDSGQSIDAIISKDMIPEILPPTVACRPLQSVVSHIGSGRSECFHFFQQSRRERIDALRTTLQRSWNCSLDDQEIRDLGAAIDHLDEIAEHMCSPELHSLYRAVCSWPSKVPRGFVDMLTSGCHPALAVYSHWLMMVMLAEGLWWIGDMGRAGIREIIDMCSAASSDIQVLLSWPRLMLDIED